MAGGRGVGDRGEEKAGWGEEGPRHAQALLQLEEREYAVRDGAWDAKYKGGLVF